MPNDQDMRDPAAVRSAINVLTKTSFRHIQRLGYHFQVNDFYSPLNDCDFLEQNRDLWSHRPSQLAWNDEQQMDMAAIVGAYVDELIDVPAVSKAGKVEYYWNNDFWNNADALVQYGLIRHFKPHRVVEVGCGWSSLLLARALRENGQECQVSLVEPYPNRLLFSALPDNWRHHPTILQRAPRGIFDELESGDVCFYDGSHCAKTASDVVWFFFEILPRLKPGVLIHLHDIFLPEEYPEEWLFQRGQSWNEQYLLQAFLMYNTSFKIVIANRYLWLTHNELLDNLYKGIQPSYGCSFWMLKEG